MNKGYLYIVIATFLFSSMEVALKISGALFHPVQITFLRFFIGFLVLFPLALRTLHMREQILTRKDYRFYAGIGFLFVVVSMILYQMAIRYGEPAVVAVLFSSNPVFVIIFAHFILNEAITKYTIVTMVLSVIGIISIMNPSHMAGNELSIGLVLLSAVLFALYGVLGAKRSLLHGGVTMTCMGFLFGSLELLALILLTKISVVDGFLRSIGMTIFTNIPVLSGITMHSLPNLLYIGVGVTGLGFATYFLAMENTSATEASLVFYIKPVLSPIIALAVLGEPITTNMIIGIVFIVVGSAISFIPKIRKVKVK